MNLKLVLEAGSISRYHNTLVDKKQTVDQHSWEVAVILQEIYPECSKELLLYALYHDCSEQATGDVPSPTKRAYPKIKLLLDKIEKEYAKTTLKLPENEFSEEEMLAVKYADILSGVYFTAYRANLGDGYAKEICGVYIEYFNQLPFLNHKTDKIIWSIL